MTQWQFRPIPFRFQLSDWTLFSVSIQLQVRMASPFTEAPSGDSLSPSTHELIDGSQGFLIRGLPIAAALRPIHRTGDYMRYVPLQYEHCYIDFSLSFENYQKKFSSKTRSTLNRKIKKYAEHCGGTIPWKSYQRPEEMRDFFRLARAVSKLTYQERLLDAGIPESEQFILQSESLAVDQRIRAYILFDDARPVAYLYCPVHKDVLIYSYLGYDPEYREMSVGTILQWLALEQLFKEDRFRYFDFTEGQSDHKRLFSTHQRFCANVFFVKNTFRNKVVIYSHLLMDRFSYWLGIVLDQMGVKARLKRLLRFAS
jgi:CelD/BcsL family acetyltransferase involved in cellulose biosynthesis